MDSIKNEEEIKIFPKCHNCGEDINYKELLNRYGPQGLYHIAKRLIEQADNDINMEQNND